MNKRKVAIACQGGGSHAAFAAGVLSGLLSGEDGDRFDQRYRLVALSGTSGGAVCASLVWSGLHSKGHDDKEGRAEASRRLLGFWRDLEAWWPLDQWINACALAFARLPFTFEVSPYLCIPFAEARLRQLLERHLRLEELRRQAQPRSCPKLLVGVTDVLRGAGKPRWGDTLTYDDIVASAAIPPIFRAVRIDHSCYWDGLFNRNPPIREFTDIAPADRPDEIWVVRVNPIERHEEPVLMREIIDRRNELAGNVALDQELYHISKINELLDDAKPEDLEHVRKVAPGLAGKLVKYRRITLRQVELPFGDLDYPSKLDRSPAHLARLFDAGIRAAGSFFQERSLILRDDLRERVKPVGAGKTETKAGSARQAA